MPDKKVDTKRDRRIYDEIIVDAHDEEEQMTGWHAYLEDTMTFPFTAQCINIRSISPLQKGEVVTVRDIAPEEDPFREIFVRIDWSGRCLGVPLSQLAPLTADRKTKQAVEDWQYWSSY